MYLDIIFLFDMLEFHLWNDFVKTIEGWGSMIGNND
jgi:hypothetical protein